MSRQQCSVQPTSSLFDTSLHYELLILVVLLVCFALESVLLPARARVLNVTTENTIAFVVSSREEITSVISLRMWIQQLGKSINGWEQVLGHGMFVVLATIMGWWGTVVSVLGGIRFLYSLA